MPKLKFITNINCKNCIRAVKPFLDNDPRITRWEVDITDPHKILTIEGEELTGSDVTEILQKAGYKGERMD